MAKKLTPTEIKTLALEATNRVYKTISEHNQKIKESDEYKNYSIIFSETLLGRKLYKALTLAEQIDKLINVHFEDDNNYATRVSPIEHTIKTTIDKASNKMRDQEYPLVTGENLIPGKTTNVTRWGGYAPFNLYDYIEHNLKIKQLTADIDINSFLDDLVKELTSQIK